MKERQNTQTIIFLSSVISVTITLIVLFIINMIFKKPTAAQIFDNSMDNVVELKSQNKDGTHAFGTAILVDSEGKFITNAHVVVYVQLAIPRQFDEYFVRFAFEHNYRSVELLHFCLEIDLAILMLVELPSFNLNPARHGNSSNLSSGDTVYAIGNSQNIGLSISKGVIGIPLIDIKYMGITRRVIQSAITVTSGNSGGALLNARGELIGITTFRLRDSLGNVIHGIAYSIPINVVTEFINLNFV